MYQFHVIFDDLPNFKEYRSSNCILAVHSTLLAYGGWLDMGMGVT